MWARTPCRIGSSAAQRSPFFATCQPTTSVTQWSTAPKNQHHPSTRVQNRAASVPHSSSGRSVRIRPPWLRSPRGRPCRTGASSPFRSAQGGDLDSQMAHGPGAALHQNSLPPDRAAAKHGVVGRGPTSKHRVL